MELYCGNTNGQIPSFTAKLQNVNGAYGKNIMYCKYVFNNLLGYKYISMKYEQNVNFFDAIISIEVIKFNGDSEIYKPQTENFVLNESDISTVYFHLITLSSSSQLPFRITSYGDDKIPKKNSLSDQIGLGLAVGTIVLIASCCALSIYKFSRRAYLSRRRNQQINNREFVDNVERVRERNTEKLKSLFETVIKPVVYNPTMNDYNINCTICLEEFKEENLVIKLKCLHLFHQNCAQEWFEKNILKPNCPICNYLVFENESDNLRTNIPINRQLDNNNNLNSNNNYENNDNLEAAVHPVEIHTNIASFQIRNNTNTHLNQSINIELVDNNNINVDTRGHNSVINHNIENRRNQLNLGSD